MPVTTAAVRVRRNIVWEARMRAMIARAGGTHAGNCRQTTSGPPLGGRYLLAEAMDRKAIWVVVVVVVAALVALVYLLRPAAERENVITGAERAENARELIAELDESDAPDYAAAFQRAQDFQREGQLADAQLLYFYAARGGHAQSEFALAEMNDPSYHSAETSLLGEPDPFQAYKWYSAAQQHGSTAAAARLDELHAWARSAAGAGDVEAERLLLQWQGR